MGPAGRLALACGCCLFGRAAAARSSLRAAASAGDGRRQRGASIPKLCVLPPKPGFDSSIEIYANVTDNTRMLQFGGSGTGSMDGIEVETMVKCKGDTPATCTDGGNGTCANCPCDQADDFYGNYEVHMAKYLVPMCQDKSRKDGFRVLLIGLGGGALPNFIMDKCPHGTFVETVEYDARMIEAATRFFGLHLQDGVNVVVTGDGGEVVQARASQGVQYDLVLVDAFSGPFQVPESCRNEKFIRNLQQIVRKNGMALQNIKMGNYENTMPIYRKVFGDDAVGSENTNGGDEMAVGHLIVAEAPWGP